MKKILLLIMIVSTSFAFSQTKTASVTGNWSNNATWGGEDPPMAMHDVIINSNITVVIDAEALCNSITSGSGSVIYVNNPLTIAGGANSSFGSSSTTFVNNTLKFQAGNLENSGDLNVSKGSQVIFSDTNSQITNNGEIQLNSDSNEFSRLIYRGSNYSGSGDFEYLRYVSNQTTAWDLIGSPVSGQTASGLTSQGNIAGNGSGDFGLGTFDNTTGADGTWNTFDLTEAINEGNLDSGKGYVMGTNNGSTLTFAGNLVTADVNVNITEGDSDGDPASATGSRWNLIANPYPTYLSVTSGAAAASDNGSDYLMKTTNLAVLHANNKMIYVWNATNYTAITEATAAASAVIAPGQGFFVGGLHTDSGSPVFSFNTGMSTEDGSDDGIAGLSGNGPSADAADPDRAELFINLNSYGQDIYTEIYFLENENVSLGYDSAYDGGIMGYFNNPVYTRTISDDNGIDLAIQAIPFSEMNDKVFSLGVHAEAGEEAIISISHNTTNPSTYVYLEDALEGTFTNLKETDFVITPDSNLEGVGRFFIHTTASTMSNEDATTNLLNVFKLDRNNFITVEGLSTQSNQTNLKLYNILGKEILSTTLLNNTNTQTISTEGLSTGIYVIKLESGNNLLTKKLIIK